MKKSSIILLLAVSTVQCLTGQSLSVRISGNLDFCEGGNTTLDAGAGYTTYQWSHGAASRFVFLQTAGNYAVTVTDNLGNSGSASVTVTERPNPTPSIGGSYYKCPNRPTFLDAGGGYEFYNWSTGATSQTITVLEVSDYKVTVTDRYGCKGTDTINIIAGRPVNIDIPDVIRLCGNDTAVLDARVAGATSYLWNDNLTDSIRIVRDSGVFNVIVTNGECVGYDTCRIYRIPPPTVELGPDTIICQGESVQINASVWGVTDYQWSDGGNGALRTLWQDGTYRLTIRFGNCRYSDSMTVYIFNKNDGQTLDTIVCDTAIRLTPKIRGARTYSWSTGLDTSTILIKKAGHYKVAMSNGRCHVTWNYNLDFKKEPNIDLGKDTVVCLEKAKHHTLKADWYGSTVKWQDSSTYPTFVATYPGGVYKVRVNNECGTQIDSQYVGFHDCQVIFVPNIFTPNGDNLNDFCQVYPTRLVKRVNFFKIFSRMGNLIYTATDFAPEDAAQNAWNGQFLGSELRSDVYVYVLEFTDLAGKTWTQSGDVTLVK
jgi:gliding motility-associated-like protein